MPKKTELELIREQQQNMKKSRSKNEQSQSTPDESPPFTDMQTKEAMSSLFLRQLGQAATSNGTIVKKLNTYEQELMYLLMNFDLKNLTEVQLHFL